MHQGRGLQLRPVHLLGRLDRERQRLLTATGWPAGRDGLGRPLRMEDVVSFDTWLTFALVLLIASAGFAQLFSF
ncbi:hypothetical protein GCM10010176_082560 [Nonomuraea spiralis]|nr:hypothetical protein GCM10010176_082560 [Nonomuraea spiralis]